MSLRTREGGRERYGFEKERGRDMGLRKREGGIYEFKKERGRESYGFEKERERVRIG